MPMTFENAFTALKDAREKFLLAMNMEPEQRDGQVKVAFFTLYESARLANTLYVAKRRYAMEDGGLLSWAKTDFQEITNTLYLRYYRQGNYDKQDLEKDFERWFERVKIYINRLHEGLKNEKSTKKADEWMKKRSPTDLPRLYKDRKYY